jgi:hypothetical protein
MVKRVKAQGDELARPLFWIASAILAVIGSFSLLLFYFSQPTIYPNPGLAAFNPPPATRLLPLPRESDAPELADLPNEPSPAPATLAQARASQTELMIKPPIAKRPISATRENDRRTYGLDWNNSNDSLNSNPAWKGPRRMSGGPKSSL